MSFKTVSTLVVKCAQALNNLAVTDENKVKIVEAGALPHYVKLLSHERNESEQTEAAHGLWMLAFKCKDDIIKEPGCLEGRYALLLIYYRHCYLCPKKDVPSRAIFVQSFHRALCISVNHKGVANCEIFS